VDASAGIRYVPNNAIYDRRRAEDDLRFLKNARAYSATTFAAAMVLHDLSQDVDAHIDDGANSKKESCGDEKIFGPHCTQATCEKVVGFLHSDQLTPTPQLGPKSFGPG
jgi:hypothetical protein